MNLFAFDMDDHRFMIAADFWIYVATWIPLTLFTYMAYRVMKATHRERKELALTPVTGSRSKFWFKRLRNPTQYQPDTEL